MDTPHELTQSEKRKIYYLKRKDKILADNKAWRERNKEQLKLYELSSERKDQRNSNAKKRYQSDPEKHREKDYKWRRENPEKRKAIRRREWLKLKAKNLPKKERTPEEIVKKKEYNARYNATHNTTKQKNAYHKSKKQSDPVYALACVFRQRLCRAFNQSDFTKKVKSEEMLGCSWVCFKQHIESRFLPGMTWENRGVNGWHVDHIIPLSVAESLEDLEWLSFYKNLRPLWAVDNFAKNCKLPCGTLAKRKRKQK